MMKRVLNQSVSLQSVDKHLTRRMTSFQAYTRHRE